MEPTNAPDREPAETPGPEGPDLVSIGLAVFFVSVILVVGALLLVPVGLWLVRGLTGLQRRLAAARLGGARLPVGTGAVCAVVLLAGGLVLAAWVRQV